MAISLKLRDKKTILMIFHYHHVKVQSHYYKVLEIRTIKIQLLDASKINK